MAISRDEAYQWLINVLLPNPPLSLLAFRALPPPLLAFRLHFVH